MCKYLIKIKSHEIHSLVQHELSDSRIEFHLLRFTVPNPIEYQKAIYTQLRNFVNFSSFPMKLTQWTNEIEWKVAVEMIISILTSLELRLLYYIYLTNIRIFLNMTLKRNFRVISESWGYNALFQYLSCTFLGFVFWVCWVYFCDKYV